MQQVSKFVCLHHLRYFGAHALNPSNPAVCNLVIRLHSLKSMATSPPISAAQTAPPNSHQAALPANAQSTTVSAQEQQALVHSPTGQSELPTEEKAAKNEFDSEALDPIVARIPVEMDVAIPLRDFRVRNLLALTPGQLIESDWDNGSDLPLLAGRMTLAWTEFEVVDTKLAVRITRLA